MDAETLARGRDRSEVCTREREEDVPPETAWQAWTQGGLAIPL